MRHSDPRRLARDRRAMAADLESRAESDFDRELVAKLREDAAALDGRAGRRRLLDGHAKAAEKRMHRLPKRKSAERRAQERIRARERSKARWERTKAERQAKLDQEAG